MKTAKNIGMACLAFLLLAGCSAGKIMKEEPVKGSYYVAIATFNDALESYVAQRPMLSNDIKAEIEPIFYEAGQAIKVWGTAVKLDDEADAYEKELAYNKIKAELFRLLFRYEILKIK